ncbi:MAG: hypothetical protein Q9M22_01420 [Mariprofundaceae bacterium]|nr:hypothetical protein [Mariprofundaceae bacterium]
MTDEEKLLEKLRKIEALHAGAATDGERDAAKSALGRMKKRIAEYKTIDPPIEYQFSLGNKWSVRLMTALLRRYDIKPYRRYRQRRTTLMAVISPSFVEEKLWPEFQALDKTLEEHIDAIACRIIAAAIFDGDEEVQEIRAIR